MQWLTTKQREEPIENLNTLKDIKITQQLDIVEQEDLKKNIDSQNFV